MTKRNYRSNPRKMKVDEEEFALYGRQMQDKLEKMSEEELRQELQKMGIDPEVTLEAVKAGLQEWGRKHGFVVKRIRDGIVIRKP